MKLVSKTIGQCLKDTAQNYGNCTALENEEWNCSYAELDMITDLLAGIINKRWRIYKGTHVGIWSLNTPNYVFMYMALAKIGAIACVLNTYLKTEEISNMLNQADVEILFYGIGCKDVIYDNLIPEIRRRSPKVRHFLHLDDKKNDIWINKDLFRNYEKKYILKNVTKLKEKVKPKDIACIIFTSGTTSSPKGVQLSHFSIINDASYTAYYMHWTHKDKMCIAVPLFHCFGLITGILCGIIQGMTIHLIHYFKAALVWRAIHQFHCTILNGVPSMFLTMIHKKEFKDFVAEHMNSGIIGGSIVSAEDYLEIRKHFPGMHLQTSYGMTETSATISISKWSASPAHQAITSGKLIAGMEGRYSRY